MGNDVSDGKPYDTACREKRKVTKRLQDRSFTVHRMGTLHLQRNRCQVPRLLPGAGKRKRRDGEALLQACALFN